jgi:uncharacterized protein
MARAPTSATRCLVHYLADPVRVFTRDNPPTGHATAVERTAAWHFVTALLASPGFAVLVPTQRHADVAGEVIMELPHLCGNLLHDAHTAILMREHGIGRICTRDTDFNQFPFLEVIDPLRL